jgi:hypothetical protein
LPPERTVLDDHPEESVEALRRASIKGARDAVLTLHTALELEARAGLAWWAAYFAMLDRLNR